MPSIVKKNKGFQARVTYNNQTKRKTFPTHKQAATWASLTHTRMIDADLYGTGTIISLASAIEEYRQSTLFDAKSDQSRRTEMKPLSFWTDHIGNQPLSKVTVDDIRQALSSEQKKAPATRRKYVSVLSCVFNFAISKSYTNTNPCIHIKEKVVNRVCAKVLTQDESDRLIRSVTQSIRPMVIFALETGARLSEIEQLRRDAVDNERKICTFFDTKNGTDREIALSNAALTAIHASRTGAKGLVFGKLNRVFWNHGRLVAKLSKVRFHDLRHTFITRKIEAGHNPITVGAYVGHKSIRSTERYTHMNAIDSSSIIED